MYIVAVCNQKGGVGKTTLTINLGAALARLGQRVLLVDPDPQGHLTEGVGLGEAYLSEQVTLYTALVGPDQAVTVGIDQLLHQPPTEPFAVTPSSFELMLAEQALYLARNREHKLAGLLAQLDGHFDWVLIDCPPVLGNLTDNALTAARAVVIPIQAEATSVHALELLFDQIESVERGLTITVQVLAVVPNLVQDSALAKRILAELRAATPALTPFELRKRVLRQAAWGRAGPSSATSPPPTPTPRPARRSPPCTNNSPGWSWPGPRKGGPAMAEGRPDRIDKLSQRFHRHATGRPPATAPRRRARHSFYLDGELTHRLDTTYRELAHQMHPQTVSKSVFLETLIEFSLDRLRPHHSSAGKDTGIANLLLSLSSPTSPTSPTSHTPRGV